jgi:predicted nucleic acid-binding protein
MSRIFLDTNFLVYMHDRSAPAKQAKALALMAGFASSSDAAVISTQVMLEYYNTLERKQKLEPPAAKRELLLLAPLETVILTSAMIAFAADLHAADSISIWDALIVTAARSAGCAKIWTEDMQDGRRFGTVEVVNPFTRY